MIGHIAGRMRTAHPWTRIPTLVVDAGPGAGTLRVHCALRLALDVGVAGVVPDAGAGGGLDPHCALRIDAAGAGVAGLHLLNRWCGGWGE